MLEQDIGNINHRIQDMLGRDSPFDIKIERDREVLDPGDKLRSERFPVVPDFGQTPYFEFDFQKPYGQKGFSPQSMFLYCNGDDRAMSIARKKTGYWKQSQPGKVLEDIENAISYFSENNAKSDKRALSYCENIFSPLDSIPEEYLGAVFSLLFRSGFDRSVRNNPECLENTWFTMEKGRIPGSGAMALACESFRKWKSGESSSGKLDLIEKLGAVVQPLAAMDQKFRETENGMTLFLDYARDGFENAFGSRQAAGHRCIQWPESDGPVNKYLLGDNDGKTTHVMLLHDCDEDENAKAIVDADARRILQWYLGDMLSVVAKEKDSDRIIEVREGVFPEDVESEVENMVENIQRPIISMHQ